MVVDSREKRPLLFPKRIPVWTTTVGTPLGQSTPTSIQVRTVVETLPAGDYTLKGHRGLVGIERKGSIDELAQNCNTKDRHRFMDALGRFLQQVRYPILYFDFVPLSVWSPRGTQQDPMHVMDRLFATIGLFNLDIVWGSRKSPSPAVRRKTGEILLRRMLHQVLCHKVKS